MSTIPILNEHMDIYYSPSVPEGHTHSKASMRFFSVTANLLHTWKYKNNNYNLTETNKKSEHETENKGFKAFFLQTE